MNVYIYIYIYIHTYVYTCTYIHVYICIYIITFFALHVARDKSTSQCQNRRQSNNANEGAAVRTPAQAVFCCIEKVGLLCAATAVDDAPRLRISFLCHSNFHLALHWRRYLPLPLPLPLPAPLPSLLPSSLPLPAPLPSLLPSSLPLPLRSCAPLPCIDVPIQIGPVWKQPSNQRLQSGFFILIPPRF